MILFIILSIYLKKSLHYSGFLQKPSHGGFGQFFPTGTYTGIGTTCVKSETGYEKYQKKGCKSDKLGYTKTGCGGRGV